VKQCSKCEIHHGFDAFFKSSFSKDGFQSQCKFCKNKWRRDNVEKCNSYKNKWVAKNPEKKAAISKRYRVLNLERERAKSKEWKIKNPGKQASYVAKRKAAKLERVSPFISEEELNQIDLLYIQAQDLTRLTGVVYHVDHIVPLQGKSVSGLHTICNLQVLTAKENLTKSNSY